MADDNLFDDKDPADKDDKPDPEKDKGGDDAAAAKVTALEAQIAELRQARAAGDGNIAQLSTAIEALTKQVQAAQGDDTPDEEPADPKGQAAALQAKFNKFYQDPEAFIAKQAAEVAKGTFGPYLRMQAEQRRDELLRQQEAHIDDLHGKGTWAKYFAPELQATLKELPLEMQASSTHLGKAVAAIYGELSLNEGSRAALEKARAEATKSRQAPPVLMDGGRPAPKAGALDENEQAFLQSLARAGIELTAKDYLDAKERGSSEDRWSRPAAKR